MVVRECPKCKKKFTHKASYNYHINKMKRPCTKIDDECVLSYKCGKCGSVFVNKSNLNRHHKNNCDTNRQTTNNMMCNYCKKRFTRYSSLKRHLNGRCIILEKIEEEKEFIYKSLLKQMKEQKEQVDKLIGKNKEHEEKIKELKMKLGTNVVNGNNNTITTQNITNTQNIFNIIAFGKENLYEMDDEECKKFLKKGYQSIPSLVNHTHFDKNKPEYHNVYISNMKDLYAMTFDGTAWMVINKDEVINQLFDDNQCFLNDKYKKLNNDLDNITKRKYGRFIEETDEKIIEGIKHDIKLLLYNKRNIPMNTRKINK